MNSSSSSFRRRRVVLYALTVGFACLSLYAYTTVPTASSSATTIEGRAEGIFLLNAGLGALIAVLYSAASRNLGSLASFSRSRLVLDFDLKIPAAIVALSLGTTLLYASVSSGSRSLLIPAPALLVFAVLSLLGAYPFRGRTDLRPLTEDGMVRFVTGRDRLKKLAEYRAQRFSSLLSRSGEIGNPYILAARSISSSIAAVVVAVPLGVVLGLFVWYPLVLVALAPALVYVYPELHLRDKGNERRDGVERELPFFSILVNVLGSAGVSLYSIFNGIIEDERIFTYIRREALLVKRDVTVFGVNPVESFERLASHHPSRKFSSFLTGYTSKVRSGGDIPSYLLGESGSLLRELQESWTRYAGRAGIVGSMMITVFGVIPLLLLVVGAFSPQVSILGLTFFAGVGVPVFTILLVLMVGRMQPVGEEPLRGNAKRSLLLSCLPGVLVGLATRELWLAAASALFLFFTLYGFSVAEQRREMTETEEALPGFLNDLMEFKRQEYDLYKSVVTIAASNTYTPPFDRILSRMASELKMGIPFEEVKVDPRSRLARMVFFVLGEMARSGGGTVETVYQLSAYTGRVVETKKSTRAELRPYLILSYISPVLLAFGVTFVGGVLTSFGSRVQPGLAGLHLSNLQIGAAPPELFQVSNLLIVISAAALGIIGAKMTDFTVRNTFRASVNVAIAVIATYALSILSIPSLLHIGL